MNRKWNIGQGQSLSQPQRSHPGNRHAPPFTKLRLSFESSHRDQQSSSTQRSADSNNRFSGDPATWVPPTRPHVKRNRQDAARTLVPSRPATKPSPKIIVPGAPTGPRNSRPHTWQDRLQSRIPINGAAPPGLLSPPISPRVDEFRDQRTNMRRSEKRKRGKRGGKKSKGIQAAAAPHRQEPAQITPHSTKFCNEPREYNLPAPMASSGRLVSTISKKPNAVFWQTGAPWQRYYQEFLPYRPLVVSPSAGLVVPGPLNQPYLFTTEEYEELKFYDRRRAYDNILGQLEHAWYKEYFACMGAGFSDNVACHRSWQVYLNGLHSGDAAERLEWDKDFVDMWNAQRQLAESLIRRVLRNDGSHNPRYTSYSTANDAEYDA